MQNGNILQQINAAADQFLEPMSLQQTYETITHQAVGLVDGIDGSILLADKNNSILKSVYSTSKMPQEGWSNEENANLAFKKRIAFTTQIHEQEGKLLIIFIPLFYQNKSLGTVVIRSSVVEKFKDDELEVLKVFGSLATLAIRKAQLYQQNQNALKVRDLFISMATHELKTPLTSMTGYVQLLHSKIKDKSGQEAMWVKTLLGETHRLNDLINEMTQTYTIKSGKVSFNWVECRLEEIIQNAVTSFSKTDPDRRVEFVNLVPKEHDSIIGDCKKLEQVFNNVLNNAEKFSSKEDLIRIELYEDGSFLTVEIIDKGKGILKEELPYIFDEFYKGKSTETLSGMGLGLFFVKNMIQQHHGKIQISSTKKGTRVIMRFKKVTL